MLVCRKVVPVPGQTTPERLILALREEPLQMKCGIHGGIEARIEIFMDIQGYGDV